MSAERIRSSTLFNSLPAEWPDDPLPEIQAAVQATGIKVVVLDDDPTGTQTVHDIPVLTTWATEALAAELQNDLPAFYILTNSRALPPEGAQALNQEIGRNLMAAGQQTGRRFFAVSRSDSTLRGHFPGEVDALAETLGGGFDAWLIIPFFLQGGRYTANNIHYVADGEWLIPAGMTEFARDAAFGYRSSNLKEWVAEKTQGRVKAGDVQAISLEEIRQGGAAQVAQRLLTLPAGAVCIINSVSERDMAVFALGLLQAEAQGKRYLARTAASFVRARTGLEPKPLLTSHELQLPSSGGGLIVVGSHVPKTSAQLHALLAQPGLQHLELDVNTLLDERRRQNEIRRVAHRAERMLIHGQHVVISTSRAQVTGTDAVASLAINHTVSESVVATVQAINTRPRFLLAKGGITSSDVATQALGVRRAMVLGQLLPGVPVWRTGAESRYPGLVYVVFPGNVGGTNALVEALERLR